MTASITNRALNRQLTERLAALTGTFFCRPCSKTRPLEGSVKRPGKSPRRCAGCAERQAQGPTHGKPKP
jgi:hypothetical protein